MRCNDFNAKILFSCKKIQQGPIVDIITCYDKSDIPTCFPQNPQKITCLIDYYSNKYHSREKFSNVDNNIGKMKQYIFTLSDANLPWFIVKKLLDRNHMNWVGKNKKK